MGFFGGIFDDDGPLGGILNLPPAKKPGKWRPGLRSTEIAIEKRFGVGGAGKKSTPAPSPGRYTGQTAPPTVPGRPSSGPIITRTPPAAKPATPLKPSLPAPPVGNRPTPAASVYLSDAEFVQLLTLTPAAIAALPDSSPLLAKRIGPERLAALTPAARDAYNKRIMRRSSQMMGLDGLFGDDMQGEETATDVASVEAGAQPGYYGNGQAWISQQVVKLYWQDNLSRYLSGKQRPGANGDSDLVFDDPITYPDGTPVEGHIWIPRANLEALYKPYVWSFPMSNGGDRFPWDGDGTVAHYFDHAPPSFPIASRNRDVLTWEPGVHTIDGKLAREVETGAKAAPWGAIEPWGVRVETGKKANTLYGYIGNNFNFAAGDPTSRAYLWLWQYVTPEILSWDARPADLWLSDGTPIGSSGNFYLAAPPPPFLCIEFLDALMTGAHGLPQVVDQASQTIDFRAFATWCAQDPQWRKLLPALQRTPFVCATIYDIVQVPTTGQLQQVPPTTSTPPPTVSVDNIDPNSGLPLPDGIAYDAATGLYYDIYTGQVVPAPYPSTGTQSPPYYDPGASQPGITYPYELGPGDTTDIPMYPYPQYADPYEGASYPQPDPYGYGFPVADEEGNFDIPEEQYTESFDVPEEQYAEEGFDPNAWGDWGGGAEEWGDDGGGW